MNQTFRKQITREFPELAAGYHLPLMAEVIAVPDAPAKGGINDNYRPRLAVNLVLLNNEYKSTEIFLDAVPIAIMGGGNERGFFAIPQQGTLVEVAFLNGSPERPFVRSILGDRQALPWIDEHTMAWQQDESVKQTVDNAGNWTRQTTNDITDKSHTHKTETHSKIDLLGEELKRVLQHSIEDIDGKKQIEATAIHLLSTTVANILALGSINQSAGEHITRSASKEIVDHAAKDLKQSSDENIKQVATKNIESASSENIIHKAAKDMELIAAKIKLGTESDNVLKLLSDFMQATTDGFTALAITTVTCAAPGSPSGVPLNAANFTAAVAAITPLKTKLDAMTK
ncbi:conserved hypothetical protein, phage-related [Oleispira antarctica RB-8]|uniref:Gp5/Type VI secretion system Vgr protein OB-fold domain-containing protein n=1 Tax=Oleispira antarctica RB-8 TaxID=698738 RepID=R4YPC6_OLEAN|nr:conserved hypothetical protein, phage-related [Oleispira antarctica RB-8]